jgi:SAM-dependent methyltransferase
VNTGVHASSLDWYDANAESFVARTFGPGMEDDRARFLANVPAGGTVLDAGCGSGRDALAFKRAGYAVSACDGSARLAEIASANTSLAVRHMTFAEMSWEFAFDGVWACASLLHLPAVELPAVLAKIRAALRPGGVFYASFKEGTAERFANGRHFTDLTRPMLRTLLASSGFEPIGLWASADGRPDHIGETWVSGLARRPLVDRTARG